ncbi:MAG: ABC transporter permease [Clostridia bacterium]|nr:ABC transporter permease [Clostridia bacterium]
MSLIMSFKMALQSIWSAKIRSFLTMLGIIIGVAAVIILVNMVTATTINMRQELESMGTNLINVSISRGGWGMTRSVSVEEIEKLAEDNPDSIGSITPIVNSRGVIKYGSSNVSSTLYGVNEAYSEIRNRNVSSGRFLAQSDVDNRASVVIIGEYVRTQLFGAQSPVGEQVKINNELFTVIGVLEQKSSNASQGSDDDCIIIPYSRATRLIKNVNINSFAVSAKDADSMTAATNAIESFLYKKFKSDDYYSVVNQADQIDTIDDALGSMTLLMAGIAGISLIVGGIGIMNIMLVTVTERTREIGIRKAIGAKTRTILVQFLIESAVVSCLGGLVGIVLGVGGSYFTCKAMSMPSVPITQQTTVILGSFLFSAVIGIFFGLYPARKAARLNPIEALRYE